MIFQEKLLFLAALKRRIKLNHLKIEYKPLIFNKLK